MNRIIALIAFLAILLGISGCGTDANVTSTSDSTEMHASDAPKSDATETYAPNAQTATEPAAPHETGRGSSMDGYVSRYNPAHIDSGEAWRLMNADSAAIMLDVRSEASYLERHVSIAINVPYEALADYVAENVADKDCIIICYCFCDDKGGSALSACNLLADLGYTKTFYTEPADEWTYKGTAATPATDGANPSDAPPSDAPPSTAIPSDPAPHNYVTGLEAKAIFESNAAAILLDVRNQDEYDEYHIDGSTLIPVAELEARLSELPDKNAIIIVYCRAGMRSARAYEILATNGYTNIYDMQKVENWPK